MKVVRLSMAVIVLFYLAKIALPTPLSPVKQGVVLNEFIRHSEPAIYDTEPLKLQRHRYKRSTEEMVPPLRINLTALNREFRLVLRPDHNIFAEEAVFEDTSGRRLQFDPGKAYTGTLEGDDAALVQGIVTEDGLFDGTISTLLEDYYIEPVRRYLTPGTLPPLGYHSIIYRSSDVTHPVSTNCASEKLARKQPEAKTRYDALDETGGRSRAKRWFPFDFLEPSNETRPKARHTVNSPTTVYHFENQSHDIHVLTNSVSKTLEEPASTRATVLTRPKHPEDSNKYPKTDHYNPPSGPKILIGMGASDDTNIIFDDDFNSRQHIHKRATIDPRKTTCMLYLQADHLFFQKYGTEEACIEVMTRHVQRVNAIYRATDFNQDGKSDNISFMIKRVKVHSSQALQDPSYRFPGNYGVEKFLELFSEEDYDAFCLAYMFTYRDFEMGTLGLAWTGDLKNAGGVCEKNGHYRGSMKSLNTGIVTLLNYGKHVPPAVSHVTLAHEIGHNFGSPHDPEICTPGGDDGNFIMFARATSGDKKNNNHFSPCSLNSINPVLNAKARSPKGCFTEPQSAICGNGVVEVGEQCDCGWEEDCHDSCCYPQRRYPPTDEPPCRLTPKSMCSPSQGPCCTSECQLKFGDKCRDDNGCRDSSFCDGRGPHCPPSINKPNKTVCNDEFVCFMGECTGSICLAYGLESCQCIPEPHEPPTKACELCCKLPGENQPCLSSFTWNSVPYDIPDMFSKPGTPCNDYNGYCDVFQKCREVDPSGPLATLRKLLLSEESIASFKRWIMDRWYYATMIVMVILCLLIFQKYIKYTNVRKIDQSKTESCYNNPQLNNRDCSFTPETDGANVVVHPAAVRSKLPLKRRVHEVSHRHRSKDPATKKIKKLEQTKRSNDNPEEPVTSSPKKVQKKNPLSKDKKKKPIKGKKKKEIIDYSAAQEKISGKTPEDDPLGKVRNWLLNSHNIAGSLAVRKSKSSPAGFTSTEPALPRSPVKPHKKSDQRGKSVSLDAGAKENVKLQVVYKPPFKFKVKLRKPTELATHVVKEINSRVNQKPRTALVIRANDRHERKRNHAKRKSRPISSEVKKVSAETMKEDVQKSSDYENVSKEKEPCGSVSPPEILTANPEETPLVPLEHGEPLYENTGNLRCATYREGSVVEEEVRPCLKPDRNVDLLRMTSVECKTQSQLPIAPEVCKTRHLSRHHSETHNHKSDKDAKKRTRRDTSRENRKRHSYSEKCTDFMRFPSVEMNNPLNKSLQGHGKASTSCDIPKRHSVPITSLSDSDLHTVPSDLEVLLSESEYLFSDA